MKKTDTHKQNASHRYDALTRHLPWVVGILMAAGCWATLYLYASDLLFAAQDCNFWQPGQLFWQQACQEPGGILCWLSCYLTQFFYYPALGISLMVGCWMAIYALLVAAFRLDWRLCWLASLPPIALMFYLLSTDYWLFVSKCQGWWYVPTLYTLLVALLLLSCRWLRRLYRGFALVLAIGISTGIAQHWMQQSMVPAELRTPFHAPYLEPHFLSELRIARAAEETRWNDVLREVRTCPDRPSRAMWLYTTVALLQQDRLSDWMEYPLLTTTPVTTNEGDLVIVSNHGPLLYYYNGAVQFAYRWSMENMVEYGPSMQRLRLMTRCAIVKGEKALALRYIDMLSRTLFWHDWAEEQRQLLMHPEQIATIPQYAIVAELSSHMPNILDGDNSQIEPYLNSTMPHLRPNGCRRLAELSLVYALHTQDIPTFWDAFFRYADLLGHEPMPIAYQQAALLYGTLEPQRIDISKMPFDPSVRETRERFNTASQNLMRRGYADEALANALRREFGHTFYWYYFFCRKQTTY